MKLEGHYIRTGDGDSAELRITSSMVQPGRYHVEGLALWGERREFGPNIGTVEFTAELEGRVIQHEDDEGGYVITLEVVDGGLVVEEHNAFGRHGMNVTFDGHYRRAGPIGGLARSLRMAIRRLLRP